jgi:hypothetical protein
LDAARISAIGSALYAACRPINDADGATQEARDLAKSLRESGMGLREQIMASVARLSHEGQWTAREVDAGCKAAAGMINDKASEKTLATFISQVKNAAHPLVASRYEAITTVVNDAWAAETEQLGIDKSSPAPLRKAFSRKFHALISVFVATTKGENPANNVDSLISFASERDPDLAADKVAKRIGAIINDLLAIHVDFPDVVLQTVAEALSNITEKTLEKSRADKLARQRDTFGAGRLENATPVTTPAEMPKATSKPRSPFVTKVTPPHAPAPAAMDDDIDALINGENTLMAMSAAA